MAGEQQTSLVGQEISGCEILQKVAVGGMGAIYKARHKALDRIVCVKILSPSLTNDKKAVELFLTEARAIAELEHPNIVQVYNVGKEKGYYFIVMAFIEGQTLSQLVKRHKTLPLDITLNLFEGILLGLDAAHSKGIIHRDIKPSNILINSQMQPKIVDFGIAKKVDKEKGSTKTTELAGTAYFIAPEQALGRDLDTRADLYSIGASLYYVLTGQFPYNGKNTIDIIQKHINDPVPNPADLRPNLPAWLAAAVQKLMSKKPEDRFQTAKETYVYFQKMHAEDQLHVKKGTSINLGENSGLKLVKEEKFSTDQITQARQMEKQIKVSTTPSKPSLLPSVEKAVTLPNTSSHKKSAANAPAPEMLDAQSAKKVNIYTPATGIVEAQLRDKARKTAHLLFNVLVKLPIFMCFTGLIAYVFHKFGVICSVHTSVDNGLIGNLVSPFIAQQYAPNQFLFMGIAAVLLILIFASAAVKAFARSTMTLFILALVAYMAGLFTPNTPFLDMHYIKDFIFTPEYYLCYLCIAMLWAVSLCFTYNRSILQGFLASALVALVITLCYLAAHLSIPPADYIITFKAFFYLSIFSAIIAVYYLANRNEKTAVILPVVFLLLGSGLMWIYMVSGAAQTVRHTTEAVASTIHAKTLNNTNSNTEIEKELNISSRREVFAQLNKITDISSMDDEDSRAFFTRHLQLVAPEQFTEENSPLFIRLLKNYYNGGESKMNSEIWSYALTLPIDNFNRDAQSNNAYSFMMLMLMILSISFCIGTLLLGEE